MSDSNEDKGEAGNKPTASGNAETDPVTIPGSSSRRE